MGGKDKGRAAILFIVLASDEKNSVFCAGDGRASSGPEALFLDDLAFFENI
jgi:hypothetical protein